MRKWPEKNSGFERDSNPRPLRYRTALISLFATVGHLLLFVLFAEKLIIQNYNKSQSQLYLHLHVSEQQQNILNSRIWEFNILSMANLLFQEENMVFSGGVDSKIVQFRQITNKVNTRIN